MHYIAFDSRGGFCGNHPRFVSALCIALLFGGAITSAQAQNHNVHTSWLWHLHQPIYWPDKRAANDHYENAWDTIQAQNTGRSEPNEALTPVFSLSDRVNAYQQQPRNTLSAIGNFTNSGAQVNMSGALMENVQSLVGQFGYSSTWYQWNVEARNWTTTGGKPRMDLVNFTYHHAMAPLVSLGSGGEQCDIPNKADQLNPAQGASNYQRLTIDRGCAPSAAMPFSYQVHTARFVDPATGAASTISIVPSDQALG